MVLRKAPATSSSFSARRFPAFHGACDKNTQRTLVVSFPPVCSPSSFLPSISLLSSSPSFAPSLHSSSPSSSLSLLSPSPPSSSSHPSSLNPLRPPIFHLPPLPPPTHPLPITKEEMGDYFTPRQHGVSCYPVAPTLKLLTTFLDKLLTIATWEKE